MNEQQRKVIRMIKKQLNVCMDSIAYHRKNNDDDMVHVSFKFAYELKNAINILNKEWSE